MDHGPNTHEGSLPHFRPSWTKAEKNWTPQFCRKPCRDGHITNSLRIQQLLLSNSQHGISRLCSVRNVWHIRPILWMPRLQRRKRRPHSCPVASGRSSLHHHEDPWCMTNTRSRPSNDQDCGALSAWNAACKCALSRNVSCPASHPHLFIHPFTFLSS